MPLCRAIDSRPLSPDSTVCVSGSISPSASAATGCAAAAAALDLKALVRKPRAAEVGMTGENAPNRLSVRLAVVPCNVSGERDERNDGPAITLLRIEPVKLDGHAEKSVRRRGSTAIHRSQNDVFKVCERCHITAITREYKPVHAARKQNIAYMTCAVSGGALI